MERLAAQGFRNLAQVELAPGPRLNVVSGDNGQGKTSLLEALYVAATTRSFRTERLAELIRHGADRAEIAVRLEEAGVSRAQRAELGERGRSFTVDGRRARSAAAHALATPIVVFHPGDLELVAGAAVGRRRLLDRVALHRDPASGEARRRHAEAMRERKLLLERGGVAAAGLDEFEAVAATYGVSLARARRAAAEELAGRLAALFPEVAPAGLALAVEYEPGGVEDTALFRAALAERRVQDHRRGTASFGPQRDELGLALEGRPARTQASQGQQRLLALTLTLAELDCVRAARHVEPVLLLDDVSSELDATRTSAVHTLVERAAGQVFVTTTRPELVGRGGASEDERRDFVVERGAVRSARSGVGG